MEQTSHKHYFYNGFYTILNESLKLEYKIPMSGIFSVEESTTPVDAYTALEQSWKKYIVKNYDKGVNDSEKLNENRIMIVLTKFEGVS